MRLNGPLRVRDANISINPSNVLSVTAQWIKRRAPPMLPHDISLIDVSKSMAAKAAKGSVHSQPENSAPRTFDKGDQVRNPWAHRCSLQILKDGCDQLPEVYRVCEGEGLKLCGMGCEEFCETRTPIEIPKITFVKPHRDGDTSAAKQALVGQVEDGLTFAQVGRGANSDIVPEITESQHHAPPMRTSLRHTPQCGKIERWDN